MKTNIISELISWVVVLILFGLLTAYSIHFVNERVFALNESETVMDILRNHIS